MRIEQKKWTPEDGWETESSEPLVMEESRIYNKATQQLSATTLLQTIQELDCRQRQALLQW